MNTSETLSSHSSVGKFEWLNHPLTRAATRIGFEAEALSYYLEKINPLWSLTSMKAQVVHIIDETHDVKTFVLRPNAHWQGVSAGQHIGVAVEVGGVIHKRRYSSSKAEATDKSTNKTVQITVKRVTGGVVSNHFYNQAQVGDVIGLDAAEGDFVLPDKLPSKLLVLTAGSGITPVFSQVATLLIAGYKGSIEFVHYVRTPEDCIFGKQLYQLAEQYDNFEVQWCYENSKSKNSPERFSSKQIQNRVTDYTERHTLLCGPAGFMSVVRKHWDDLGLNDSLSFEYFGAPPMGAKDEVDAEITLKTGKQIQLRAGESILDSLIANGETPKYGCKRGVCHECKCLKTNGAVKNLLTGNVSDSGEEYIQLCISAPVTNVTLA